MPAYNEGTVIRGGFGSVFRRIVCHANCREPETCELRSVVSVYGGVSTVRAGSWELVSIRSIYDNDCLPLRFAGLDKD